VGVGSSPRRGDIGRALQPRRPVSVSHYRMAQRSLSTSPAGS
jgi:hypothetical protein